MFSGKQEVDMSKWSSPGEIPHAKKVYVEGHTLHVVTDLMHFSDSAGFDRPRHDEMMRWVAWFAGYNPDQRPSNIVKYSNYVIHPRISPRT